MLTCCYPLCLTVLLVFNLIIFEANAATPAELKRAVCYNGKKFRCGVNEQCIVLPTSPQCLDAKPPCPKFKCQRKPGIPPPQSEPEPFEFQFP